MTREVISYRTQDGSVVAITGTPGRIYTPMVFIDHPVRLYKVPNGDIKSYRRELPKKLRPTAKRTARGMLKAGKVLGITKGAKAFLRSCL